MVYEGNSFRAVGCILDVHNQSVINWVNAAHARLHVPEREQQQQQQQQQPDLPRVAIVEADELSKPMSNGLRWRKKDASLPVFLLFSLWQLSGLIISHRAVWQRSIPVMQDWVDEIKERAQLTGLVYSDGFEPYKHLDYGKDGTARHQVGKGKSQTYTVEGFHANVRHYLARMRRKTRCITRSFTALQKAIDLFVFCHNTRKRKLLEENSTVNFTYALSLLC